MTQTHSLSDLAIARLVGPQSFTRGERYANHGHVSRLGWAESGTRLYGAVDGTRSKPYVVTVAFQQSAAGVLGNPDGACSCPVAHNCKHVAALLIASRDASTKPVKPVSALARPVRTSSPHITAAVAPPPPATPSVDWQKALGPLAKAPPPAMSTGVPLAIQFELLPPPISRRSPDSPLPMQRLGARPMTVGKKGKWIRNGLTWENLSYAGGNLNKAQRKILTVLYEQFSAGRRYYSYADHWIHLNDFSSRTLWDLLADVRETGVALISTNRLQDPVVLSDSAAELALDITRSASGLNLMPTITLDGRTLNPGALTFIGSPAHGIASWTGSAGAASAADATGKPIEFQLTLAPLSAPISPAIRDLATAQTALAIPTADEAIFLTGYYPFLREQLTLTSSNDSFELTAPPQPVLALNISDRPDARIALDWHWCYTAPESGPDTKPAFVHRLWPEPGMTGYRHAAREAEILRSVSGILGRFARLGEVGTSRLAESAELAGSAMIDFLGTELAGLESTDHVLVTFVGGRPDYREADEAPLITVATHERVDDRDWFDLAVNVSVDGQEIPFDDLFRALATEQEILILPGGVWFNLDRPELHQLRRLIEEARGLQDSSAPSLGISRFQSDLWDELQELGIVTAQAAAWRNAVAGLSEGATIQRQALPDGVRATLRGYQQEGFDWLSFLYDQGLGGVLADDMGLGKTLQAIALIAHTRQPKPGSSSAPAPFLVVAPTSVVPNWAAECEKFAPGLNVVAITETSARRLHSIAELAGGADVVITSYTLFRLGFEEYNDQEWAGLLLDEAQFVKNHQARAHQCARRLNAPFKLAITGTPMENNVMELWSLLSITAPGLFPSPSRFAEYYQKPIEKDGDAGQLAQLRRRIRPFMLRRTKDQVASDLPAKQEQVLELELHPKHRKVYQTHLQRERQKVLGLIEDMNANRFEIFRSLTMLRQLSLDASLYDEKYADIPSTKLDALLELLDDVVAEGHRTLIFSQFTGYLAKARSRLDAAGIAYSYLDGKTRNRAKAIDDFKTGVNPVFLISLKAGGFGLNLTEADYVILLDPWWNPATEAQAVDRTHRIGQTKHVMVYRLVSKDTIEEKVMALKSAKAALFDSVMTGGAAAGSTFSATDIRELLE